MNPHENQLPYATNEVAAVPGTIKMRYEDFEVEEIPAYSPSGQGDHLYFEVEKRGLSTRRALNDISRALGVRISDIGVAGMKDARAVTKQTMSLEHADEARLRAVSIPRIKLTPLGLHGNKLRMGHLRGNRFRIKLRETDVSRLSDVEAVLSKLVSYGVPNYFGPQRFGNRGDTWLVGLYLLLGDYDGAAGQIAGRPGETDTGDVRRARESFARGRYEEAARLWPRGFFECVTICRNMARFGGDSQKAVMKLDKKTLGLYVSACQSWLFNQILAQRTGELDRVVKGDVAWKHDSGAAFLVEDEIQETPRAARFEISATGPLFGPKMKETAGVPREAEEAVLRGAGLTLGHFKKNGPLRCPGGRRPLRFPVAEASVSAGNDEYGDYIELGFLLPSGCYATALIREICKEQIANGDHME